VADVGPGLDATSGPTSEMGDSAANEQLNHSFAWKRPPTEALGDATNNVAEYTAVRNALRAAADAGATSAHVRMDSPVVFGHLSGASRARAEHLIQLKEEVAPQVARYPGRVTFARIPRERNGVADELAKDGARASKALSADRRR
jgi:ribonuclease H / adenosylcobalamin/alpha-ribazole phosphatase